MHNSDQFSRGRRSTLISEKLKSNRDKDKIKVYVDTVYTQTGGREGSREGGGRTDTESKWKHIHCHT